LKRLSSPRPQGIYVDVFIETRSPFWQATNETYKQLDNTYRMHIGRVDLEVKSWREERIVVLEEPVVHAHPTGERVLAPALGVVVGVAEKRSLVRKMFALPAVPELETVVGDGLGVVLDVDRVVGHNELGDHLEVVLL
jgi:hypothetical protein